MTMIKGHPSYKYACQVLKGKVNAPRYVIAQAADFKAVADGTDSKYCINEKKLKKVDGLLKLMVMPKGLKAGKSIYDAMAGYQWLFAVACLCVVYRDDRKRRRYETAILEIARKNFKTYTIGILFILLMLMEPQFSKLFSVAPDGSLSREVKAAIEEILKASPALRPEDFAEKYFKIRRDDITFRPKDTVYIPLNYSNGRLDGGLPSVFLVDEAGALPNSYAIQAMRSGQLTILNKLGCIISTKYPKFDNPFEDEVAYAKRVLDGIEPDEKLFALLYEPDDTENWMTNDEVLMHANPAALEIPALWDDLIDRRRRAVSVESSRENFLCKHCNIIYQGIGTESYIPINQVQACRVDEIDWTGREVYLGVDLSMSNDNCAVAMVAEDGGSILADVTAFIPDGRVDEKNAAEHLDYRRFIRAGKCVACGGKTVDYSVIEDFVFNLEKACKVKVMGIAYDRYNALSSAQKWERGKDGGDGYNTVVVRQHSDTLHPPTKLLAELIADGKFQYERNDLLEINFQNARCTYDTNMNRYVNKKRSNGKVDMVVALINATYLLQQNVYFDDGPGWTIQVF